ncbi:MAG: hypothetical protein H0V66_04740 [Bdellovibrionales bacterium]|nr:hypothetical protein [Bdellovibrionales bacterium]
MKKLFFTLICLSLLSFESQAQAQFGNYDNVPNAALNTTTALIRTFTKENIPKDSVSGMCEFSGSNCNGAEITLFKGNQRIYVGTLTSRGEFKIPGLKKSETYQFILNWPKHGLSQNRTVETGEFIDIKLTQKTKIQTH